MDTPTLRRVLTLAAAALAVTAAIVLAQPQTPKPTKSPPAGENRDSVRLTYDFADGVQITFTTLPHSADMTVLDAMKLARAHGRGVTFESKGSGDTAFITQIADLKNEGGGETARNWIYKLNGQRGSRGVGAAKLEPGDVILWEFRPFNHPQEAPAPASGH